MVVSTEKFPHLLIIVRVQPRPGRRIANVKSRVGSWTVVAIHHLRAEARMAIDRHVLAREGWTAHMLLCLVLHVLRLSLVSELRAHAIMSRRLDRKVACLLIGHAMGKDILG